MLRNVSVFACLVVVAIGLVAAAEPQQSASNWVPAGQLRDTVYRPGVTDALTLEAAQTGSPSVADRLKAARGGVSGTLDSGSVGGLAEPAVLPDDTTGTQLPSVLVRRGSRAPERATEPAIDPGMADGGLAEGAADAADAAADSARRTARRPRTETPTFRSPVASSGSLARTSESGSLSLTSQGPTITVETDGPRAIAVGKAATYHVRLMNQGTADADHMILTVAVPAWAQITSSQSRVGSVSADEDVESGRRVVWDLERVAARSQQELTLVLQPTESRPIDLIVEWVLRGAPAQASIEVQEPKLAMTVEGPAEMRYGSTSVFKVHLSNPGNGAAENVVVTVGATGIANQPNTVGTLAAGESRSLEIEFTAKQAGTMKIAAAAQADGGLRAETAREVQVRRAQLAVKVTAPSMLYAGATAAYEIRVANTGDAAAEGVMLEVQLPTGHKNTIGVDKKPVQHGTPRWQLGDLPPGTDRVYTMQSDLVTGGQHQVVARITGKEDGQASDTAVVTVEAIADLKLIVNDPQGPLPVGKEVPYEIVVVNRGSKEATDVHLVAQFSEGIEPTSATGHGAEIVPGQVIFKPIAAVPAGKQVTVKVMAAAQAAGTVRFRAELTCSTPETRLVAEQTTRFYGEAATGRSAPQAADRSSDEPTPARR